MCGAVYPNQGHTEGTWRNGRLQLTETKTLRMVEAGESKNKMVLILRNLLNL
jgi:hypothetical protein